MRDAVDRPLGDGAEPSDPAWRPGDRAYLEVEVLDYPAGDMTNVMCAKDRLLVRWWVQTKLLFRRLPRG